MLKFAERLKELRAERGLSQRKLAKLIGVSDKAISLWENNESVPNFEAVVVISQFFKVSLEYLAGLED